MCAFGGVTAGGSIFAGLGVATVVGAEDSTGLGAAGTNSAGSAFMSWVST